MSSDMVFEEGDIARVTDNISTDSHYSPITKRVWYGVWAGSLVIIKHAFNNKRVWCKVKDGTDERELDAKSLILVAKYSDEYFKVGDKVLIADTLRGDTHWRHHTVNDVYREPACIGKEGKVTDINRLFDKTISVQVLVDGYLFNFDVYSLTKVIKN